VLLVSCLLLSGAGSYQGLISFKQKLLVPLLCLISAALCLDKSPLRDRAMGLMFAALAYVFFKTHQVAFFFFWLFIDFPDKVYVAIPYFLLSVLFSLYPQQKTVEFELM
jgi:hypothetical protein